MMSVALNRPIALQPERPPPPSPVVVPAIVQSHRLNIDVSGKVAQSTQKFAPFYVAARVLSHQPLLIQHSQQEPASINITTADGRQDGLL